MTYHTNYEDEDEVEVHTVDSIFVIGQGAPACASGGAQQVAAVQQRRRCTRPPRARRDRTSETSPRENRVALGARTTVQRGRGPPLAQRWVRPNGRGDGSRAVP